MGHAIFPRELNRFRFRRIWFLLKRFGRSSRSHRPCLLAIAYLNDNFICIDSGFPVEVLFSPSGTTAVEGTLLRTCKVAILIESYFKEDAPQLISCSGCNVKEDPRRNRFKLRIFGKSKFNVFIVFLISSGNVPRSPIDFFGYICKDFFKRKLKFCYTS